MKKHIVLLLAALLLLSGCAAKPSISPAKFSKETQTVLDTIGNTWFFDYVPGDGVQSFHVDYWTLADGEWSRETAMEAFQLENKPACLGLRFEPETLYVYTEGAKYTLPFVMAPTLLEGKAKMSNPLMSAREIVPGEDIILYQCLYSEDGNMLNSDLGSFAATDYAGGVALTVTFCESALGE